MANPVIRAFPVYYRNQKIATAYDNGMDIKPNRQASFGAEGYLAHTRGAIVTSVTVQYMIPVSGVGLPFLQDCIDQNDVTLGIPVGGDKSNKFVQLEAAITGNQMKANTETGRCEGTMTFEGGKPSLQ